MNGTRRREIAARLRTILNLETPDSIADAAKALDVDETSLRMSIDLDSPYPTIDVLTAVAERHGIDPTYLLTGVYDIETHRRALGGDPGKLADAIREATGTRVTGPIAKPPAEPPRIHIV
jgi:hypothetical protein